MSYSLIILVDVKPQKILAANFSVIYLSVLFSSGNLGICLFARHRIIYSKIFWLSHLIRCFKNRRGLNFTKMRVHSQKKSLSILSTNLEYNGYTKKTDNSYESERKRFA
ncbi:MAG: hypothetical protein DRR19_02665 [Candidatus Parabeggiatoa sp. nov. 1]|nr:MAG: hypothetical protein DRR19_02665 [Gammaproteobacteria bacterium]